MSDENKEPDSVQSEAIQSEVNAFVALWAAIDRGGYDVSPCMICQEPVVCIADGLAMCKYCAEKANQ